MDQPTRFDSFFWISRFDSDAEEYFCVVVPEKEDGAAYDNDIGSGDEGPGMFGECDFCVDNEVCKVCGNNDGCPPGFEYPAGQLCGICGARDEHMTGGCPHMVLRLEKCRERLEDWKKWMLSRGREGFWSGIVYSGTVAGAREAFFNGVPAVSVSYDWVEGKSHINDFTLAAEACLPIVNAILVEIKNKTYPQRCFLNVDLPTNVANNKGYKLTRQGKSKIKKTWRQVTSCSMPKMLSSMQMETGSATSNEIDKSTTPKEHPLFSREVTGFQHDNDNDNDDDDDDTDHKCLQEGYITVTPLGTFCNAEIDCNTYLKEWLPNVSDLSSSSAL